MRKIFLIIWISGCVVLAFFMIKDIYNDRLKNQDIEITVGEEYLFSFDWEEENPFEQKIDTAKVLEIRGDYVKWTYLRWPEGEFQSSETKYFKHLIRKL